MKRPSLAGPRPALLILPTLLLSHELIYLVAHGSGAGYERAMLEGGHERYWTTFVLIVGVLSAVIAGVVAVQLHRLHVQARALRGSGVLPEGGARDLVRRTLASGSRVAFAATAAFLVQETAERGGASPGGPLAAVTGEHAIALPVILVVSMLVAFVAALVRWRRRLLLARMRAARTCAPRIRQQRRPAAVTSALVGATMMCRNLLRAPPRQVAAA